MQHAILLDLFSISKYISNIYFVNGKLQSLRISCCVYVIKLNISFKKKVSSIQLHFMYFVSFY